MDFTAKKRFPVRDIVYIALFAVIITICSWIAIPMPVPFTLQTFGIFAALVMLGGKKGTISICVYIMLGIIGLPVFAGFKNGAAALLGTTGGYIIGFVIAGLIYWLITRLFGNKLAVTIIALAASLLICYAFGTAWFMIVYAQSNEAVGLLTALGWCVFPFILPDIVKISLAVLVGMRLKKLLPSMAQI